MDRKTAERLLKGGRKGTQSWNKKRQTDDDIPFLCGINLSSANLCEVDLSGLNLTGSNLQAADLSNADLSGSNLFEANLSEADLTEADLSGASLTWTKLNGASLVKAGLAEAELFETDLSWANLSNANLQDANLSGSDLTKANLSGADLSGAILTRANLTRAILLRAKLQGVSLLDADLDQANLSSCDLQRANLVSANLTAALLVEANLDQANLSQCKLCDADLCDWSINAIICDGVFWDREGNETRYQPGEFEGQFGASRSIQLNYVKRMSNLDIATLPIILHGIEQRENCELYINAIEQFTNRSVVKISIGSTGSMAQLCDEIQAIPERQGMMKAGKIMASLQDALLGRVKINPVANNEAVDGDTNYDVEVDVLIEEPTQEKSSCGTQQPVSKDTGNFKQLYRNIVELSTIEDTKYNASAKAALLAQLWSLSEKKIKSLDQPCLHVLKFLLNNLTAESANIASKVLQHGLSEKRIGRERTSH